LSRIFQYSDQDFFLPATKVNYTIVASELCKQSIRTLKIFKFSFETQEGKNTEPDIGAHI
jgi:hypothetical protein